MNSRIPFLSALLLADGFDIGNRKSMLWEREKAKRSPELVEELKAKAEEKRQRKAKRGW